jgi:hypothetical protein
MLLGLSYMHGRKILHRDFKVCARLQEAAVAGSKHGRCHEDCRLCRHAAPVLILPAGLSTCAHPVCAVLPRMSDLECVP